MLSLQIFGDSLGAKDVAKIPEHRTVGLNSVITQNARIIIVLFWGSDTQMHEGGAVLSNLSSEFIEPHPPSSLFSMARVTALGDGCAY